MKTSSLRQAVPVLRRPARLWLKSCLLLSALFLAAFTLIVPAINPVSSATVTTSIYDDALAAGWQNWSWGSTINLAATNPVQAGARSIGVTYNAGWAGLFLHHDSGVSLAGKSTLNFAIHGGSGGNQSIQIHAEDTAAKPSVLLNQYVTGGAVAAGAWREVSIPLADLGLSTASLTGIVLQDASNGSQGTFYVDSMRLTGAGATPTPGPTPTPYPRANPAGAVPTALPSHFMLGLSNNPDELKWMTASGIAWDARYQYLTSGVNTGAGWATWNSPAGDFATRYMNESRSAGYLPVFTYYQILASKPRPYDEQASAYTEKFANADTMRDYYADFKLLMQKAGAFDAPVIVHVEPDTWGYMMKEQNDPNSYPIQVAGSGHADAANLPNTAVGFARMLVRLRNRYAPKVLLALHASAWAAGDDVFLNNDPNYDVTAHANRTGDWLLKLGLGWNLVFVDLADRDAGYYQTVFNRPNVWWDERNLTLPNFNRAAFWISKLNQKMRKRVIIWQVPVGNTIMRSCNNTDQHYQDNRAQYFLGAGYGLSHVAQFARSGVIGILCGRGNGDTTTYTDAKKDGITNPAPINDNKKVATVADDDGGYLRSRATIYYQNPYTLH